MSATARKTTAMSSVPSPTGDASEPSRNVIQFPKGLPGFEGCRRFVLMAAEHGGLQVLASVEGPPAQFLVVDPRRVQAGYRCQLSEADRHTLAASADADGVADADASLLWLSLVMVEPDGTVTVNLRAPIVVNPSRMVGQQVIPYDSIYPLRHILMKGQ